MDQAVASGFFWRCVGSASRFKRYDERCSKRIGQRDGRWVADSLCRSSDPQCVQRCPTRRRSLMQEARMSEARA